MTQTETARPPAEHLMNLLVILLTPMFLVAGDGNINLARIAALETINAYKARNNADLIAVSLIIANSLAALGSLGMSLVDDVSVAMTLKLRGNANGLDRSAERNRRVLRESLADHRPQASAPPVIAPPVIEEPIDEAYELAAMASVAAASESKARLAATLQAAQTAAAPPEPKPEPKPTPAPAAKTPTPSKPSRFPEMSDRQRETLWAAAMTDVAADCIANIKNLPPAERRVASIRAQALSTCAQELFTDTVPEGWRSDPLNRALRQALGR